MVGLGIQGALSQQHRVLLRGHTRLIIESVVSDFLHVNPIGDGAMLDGVLEGQDATLALGLATHVSVFLPLAHMMLWCQGRPTMDGNTAWGASSPAKPTLHMPESLSMTSAVLSSSIVISGGGGPGAEEQTTEQQEDKEREPAATRQVF